MTGPTNTDEKYVVSVFAGQAKHIISREVGVLYLIGLLGLKAPTEAKQLLQDWHVSLTLEGMCKIFTRRQPLSSSTKDQNLLMSPSVDYKIILFL